jgi:acylphosphatase
MPMTNSPQRRHVLYEGRVQGVGFRWTCQHISKRFSVTGYVKNLPNGSVELVVEGEADEMSRFLGQIAEQMGGNIHFADVREETSTSEFDGFGVSY